MLKFEWTKQHTVALIYTCVTILLAIPLVLIVAGYVIYLRKYKISKEFYDSMLADIKSREAEASADR